MIQTVSITPATGKLMKATGMARFPSLFATGGGVGNRTDGLLKAGSGREAAAAMDFDGALREHQPE